MFQKSLSSKEGITCYRSQSFHQEQRKYLDDINQIFALHESFLVAMKHIKNLMKNTRNEENSNWTIQNARFPLRDRSPPSFQGSRCFQTHLRRFYSMIKRIWRSTFLVEITLFESEEIVPSPREFGLRYTKNGIPVNKWSSRENHVDVEIWSTTTESENNRQQRGYSSFLLVAQTGERSEEKRKRKKQNRKGTVSILSFWEWELYICFFFSAFFKSSMRLICTKYGKIRLFSTLLFRLLVFPRQQQKRRSKRPTEKYIGMCLVWSINRKLLLCIQTN